MAKNLTMTAAEMVEAGYLYANKGGNGDTYPFEVVGTKGKTTVLIRGMNTSAAEGHDYFGTQKWNITSDETATVFEVTLRRNLVGQVKGIASNKYGNSWMYVFSKEPHYSQNPHF